MSSAIPIGDATLRSLAEAHGVCVRPVLRTLTDRLTESTTAVTIPCGSTRESKCPPCATKAKRLRAHQCSEGWHLLDDPLATSADLVDDQVEDVGEQVDDEVDGADDEEGEEVEEPERRTRSTRRRTDATDLPKVPVEHRTVGASFTSPDGKTYRPSMFVTLTLPSYGRIVRGRGVPADPGTYDYRRAALDALHFPKLVDRWWQNLRRCAGYKVQYFAAVEPQRRLAPHLHAAIRGAIPRTTLKAVTKATYLQLWWPAFDEPVYLDDQVPVWDADGKRYRDPDTGFALPTWAQALDRLDEDLDADPSQRPAHVMRFGAQVDAQGIIAPSKDADRTVRYLTKYLTKSVSDTYADPDDPDAAYEAHIDRLHEHVRWLPCSPACANWLRYGITPDDPGPGLTPGACPSKAHDRECLGLGGRRVLVSRHWTGKTLTEHRADRAAVVHQVLAEAGIDAPETRRCAADVLAEDGKPWFVWADIAEHDESYDYAAAIASSVAQAKRWREQYDHAKTVAEQRGSLPGVPVDSRSASNDELATEAA